jgi:hypothetical protein
VLVFAASLNLRNKSRAAERLNWSHMTLYRKMAKYKLFDGAVKIQRPASKDPEALASSKRSA